MRKNLLQLFLFVFSFAGFANKTKANDLIIAGSTSAASIVIGTTATATERYAAEELQRCIRIMSGRELSIVTTGGGSVQIIIGTPQTNSSINSAINILNLDTASREHVVVRRVGNTLYLAGQTPGAALYATYTFLQDVLGVRWLWPDESGEFIPKRDIVTIGEINISEKPDLEIRSLAIVNVTNSYPETDTWQARNRMNLISVPEGTSPTLPAIANRLVKGFQTRIAGHNIVLPQSILTAHPEYAALYNGSRSFADASKAQLCWGNPGVQQEVANMLKSWWNENPHVNIIHYYPADNQSYCQDELCKNLATDISTRWQKFSQLVMDKVDETHPGKRYWTYAYQGYKRVPQTVAQRFESIGYTHYEVSYRKLISGGYAPNAASVAEIDGWLNKGAKVGIRGYEYIMFDEPMFVPLVSWEVDQMKWMVDKGLNAYLSETRPYNSPRNIAPENTYWTCNRMNLYAAAKAMWNSDITADSLVKDWCQTVYGPASGDMIAYYWDIENKWRNAPGNIQEYNNPPASDVDNFLSPADFSRLNSYFTNARTKLATISDTLLRRRIAAQIDLESKMLANWQTVYNFKHNRAGHFETIIEKADTLDDAKWNSVSRLPAFEDSTGEAVDEQTIVSKAWTLTDLHLRIFCQDNKIASRIANATTDDDINITADDCIELFIQPNTGNNSYLHLAVNTRGKKYDAISANGGSDLDKSWNGNWTNTVAIKSDGWSVDITIPFTALGIIPEDSAKFKLSVKRSRAGRAVNSGWPDASYFNPAAFGLATLVSELPDLAAKRIILYDNASTAGGNVSTEFQQRGWQVVNGITGEDELREKLNDDAAVLLLRYTSTSPLISNEFYLNEIKNFIEKGRVVIISTARNIPVDQWFPGTPAVNWSGNNQNVGSAVSSFRLPGAWQTYPNNLGTELRTKPCPVTAYIPQAEGWRVLLRMPMKDSSHQPFLLTRQIGNGLLVLTSSNMGYSGGYEVFGSRHILNAVKLTENFVAETATFSESKRDQLITFDSIPGKMIGDADFEINATSSSGLPVSLASSDSSVAIVTENTVQITGIGTTIITASQPGNDVYNAAENVTRLFIVVGDTIAPTAPAALTATKTTMHKVILNWLPSTDNIGVTSYNIFRNGMQLNSSILTDTSYLAERPIGKDVYEFVVVATDSTGNISLPSNTAISANGNIQTDATVEETIADSSVLLNQSAEFAIYPNPAHKGFRISLDNNENGRINIELLNSAGVLLKRIIDIKSGIYHKEIDVSNLPAGTYVLRVTINNRYQSKTLLIN